MLDQRGQLLRAAVGFAGCSMPSYDRALWALRTWLDTWSGIGHVAVGMHRQGYDLQLTQYDESGWRATFYTTGIRHSPTSATGTAWERTPWHATQRAASEALRKIQEGDRVMRLAPVGSLLVALWLVAGCGAPIQKREPAVGTSLAPYRQQVLDAAKRITLRSGIDGDPIPLDSRDPQANDYLEQVRRRIKEKWGYPCIKDVASGRCDYKPARLVIVFGILKDGRVPTLEVAQQSAYAIYDDYAANAIRLAQPFSPVPPELMALAKAESAGIIVVAGFDYVLQPAPTLFERLRHLF